MSKYKQILVVEDDHHLGFLLSEFLEEEGYQVKLCEDGKSGWNALQRRKFDLCILDVMMPQMDGFQLAQQIKKTYPSLPFLFITAKTQKIDKLKGFQLGAEDYISKPFDEEELLCRIQVIMRRQNDKGPKPSQQFQIGAFHFDYELQLLSRGDTSYRLTEKENEVLYQLCLHKNQILKREEAVEAIYGKKDYFLGRSFDVFISKIRKLLKDDPKIQIENVFKVGFIFHVEE
jgi:DNA-binding response OmpR family regulator